MAIWDILSAILLIGNFQFDDSEFNESDKPCKFKD